MITIRSRGPELAARERGTPPNHVDDRDDPGDDRDSVADAVRAAGQLGHKNPSLTLDTYARDFAEAQRNEDLSRRLDASGFGV